MKRYSYCILGLACFAAAVSCGKDADGNPIDPLGQVQKEIGKLCGLGCPGDKDGDGVVIKGVVDGNTAISGVGRVDAFFGSVANFRSTADNVSAGIEAQLAAIRADFGLKADADIEAALDTQLAANLQGSLVIEYQPARCSIDAKATFEANARCEAKVVPPQVELECKGSCELDASAEVKCDAGVELECTFTGPTVDCEGTCEGTCEAKVDVAAKCEGTCRGTCAGTCSAYSDSGATQCAGSCTGECMGSCEAKASATAMCKGTCRGECTVTKPSGTCTGAAHAACKAKANASIMCKGKCEGDFVPPEASAECEASAKAEAKLNVQCTPPRLEARYALKADLDLMARAKFEAAIKTLVDVRLPALLQASAKAKYVAQAGEDLAVAGKAAVKASVDAAISNDLSVKGYLGLGCAVRELPKVEEAVGDSIDRLNENLLLSAEVTSALGM